MPVPRLWIRSAEVRGGGTSLGEWEHNITAGAPVAQWVKRWPPDLVDRVRSSLEVKSSQP